MKSKHRALKITAIIMSVIIITLSLSIFLILEPNFKIYGWQALDTSKLSQTQRTITILDSKDNIMADSIYASNKQYVSIDRIPKHTIDAFISIEDKKFYNHSGVDYKRILGAIKENIFSKSYKEGASTITQQLIKNTHLYNEKTISRKLQEIRIARDLERKYTKDEILEMYLNILYFGNNMYGISTAAKLLFEKNVENLNLAESALLAGIINNPNKYNPYKFKENAFTRRNLVLLQMKNQNKISDDEYKKSSSEQIYLTESSGNNNLQYINAVLKEASEVLKIKEENLFKYKFTIGTNINILYQEQITNTMRDITLNNNIYSHVIVLENKTGKIISDCGNTNMNLSYTRRQPGSTIKPFLSYAPSYEKNLVYSSSLILDEKCNFGEYTPRNYKNKYYGYVSVKESLKDSLNIPAVKLMEKTGVEESKNFAKKCGITFTKDDKSLALALGGLQNGLTLKELAGAYQTFGNNGVHIDCTYIEYIKDINGKIIYKNHPSPIKSMRDDTAYLITDSLLECTKNGTAKKMKYLANTAAKTGTVGQGLLNTDAYCIAYTPTHTIAVWYGSKNNNYADLISGGDYPTIIAGSIIKKLNLNNSTFKVPESITMLDIDIKKLVETNEIMLAANDILPRYRQKEIFSINNIPKKYSYANEPDIFSKDFNEIDMNNFEILFNN